MSDPTEIPLGPEPTPPPPSTFPAASRPVPYAEPSTPTGVPYTGPAPTPDAMTMGMLAHLLNFTLLGPLLIYLLKKDEHPFIADQSKESLNFAICCMIGHVIATVLDMVVCVGVLIHLAVFALQIVFGIIGALKARDGVAYRYPLTVRFIR